MSLPAGADHPFFDAPITPRVLRGQWRPRRDAYAAAGLYEQVRIRIHRALTWLEASEARGASELDTQLIEQWVALNALYGRWDAQRREPVTDGRALALFIDQLVAADEDGILSGFLHRQKDLVMQVFADRYVNRLFWDEPVDGQRIDRAVFDAGACSRRASTRWWCPGSSRGSTSCGANWSMGVRATAGATTGARSSAARSCCGSSRWWRCT
jgi:hypothetical protein